MTIDLKLIMTKYSKSSGGWNHGNTWGPLSTLGGSINLLQVIKNGKMGDSRTHHKTSGKTDSICNGIKLTLALTSCLLGAAFDGVMLYGGSITSTGGSPSGKE